MNPPTERQLNTGEVILNYAEWPQNSGSGRERPPILLVHGLSSHWRSWMPVLPAFTTRWHVYAVDLRGHGRSGRPANSASDSVAAYGRPAYSRDLVAFLRGVIKSEACVVGHSLGGLSVLGMTASAPSLVRAVVLEDPPLFVRDRPESGPGRPEFTDNARLAKSDLSVGQIRGQLRKRMPEAADAVVDDLAERLHQMDGCVWDAVFSGTYANAKDSEPILKAASRPALLLQAELSLGGVLSDEEAARALSLLPAGSLTKWPDSHHGMHSAFPERFVEQVEGFFAGV